jgi:MFS family permease
VSQSRGGTAEAPLLPGGARGWAPAPRPPWGAPRPTLVVLGASFVLFGAIIGAQGVLWADVMGALRLSEGTFGAALLVPALVAVAVMLAGGPLCAWAGTKRLTMASLALLGAAALALAAADRLGTFLAALGLHGAGLGLVETAVNGAVLDWEQGSGRRAMNGLHAGFSAGAVAGALGAGALLGLGWRYDAVLTALGLLCGPVLLATLPVPYPPPAAGGPETPGLVATLGVVVESVANTWSVIHLRAVGAPIFVGAAAFALFNGAMLAGRLVNGQLVGRLGARVSLQVSGGGLVVAALLLVVPGRVGLAVAAFLVLGLAVAGIIPTVLSAAARVVPASSGAVAGAIMATAYAGFILCPPVVGVLAELVSLRLALLSVGVSGLGILWLTRERSAT